MVISLYQPVVYLVAVIRAPTRILFPFRRNQAMRPECRNFLILVKDLGYGDTEQLTSLAEVSRLLNAYAAAILSSGF